MSTCPHCGATIYIFTNPSEFDPPPCPGARLMLLPRWDARTFPDEATHDARFPGAPWRGSGTDHTTWSKGICRRIEERVWAIFARSLDDLLTLFPPNTVIQAVRSQTAYRSFAHPDLPSPYIQVTINPDPH